MELGLSRACTWYWIHQPCSLPGSHQASEGFASKKKHCFISILLYIHLEHFNFFYGF